MEANLIELFQLVEVGVIFGAAELIFSLAFFMRENGNAQIKRKFSADICTIYFNVKSRL